MIRLLPLLAAFLAVPALAAERGYSVGDFTRISVEGPFVVTLATGRPSAVRAEGDARALDAVAIEVQGQTLRIRANRSSWTAPGATPPGPVRVTVSTRALDRASVGGAGRLDIDAVRGLRLDLSVEGAGQLSVGEVAVDNLFAGLAGSGRIALAGTAKSLRANIRGSGDLAAAGLVADHAVVDSATAGTVRLTARRTARVTAIGLGEVEIAGRPACTVDSTGAGQVRCGANR